MKLITNLKNADKATQNRVYQDKANKKRTDLERDEAIRQMLNNEEIR